MNSNGLKKAGGVLVGAGFVLGFVPTGQEHCGSVFSPGSHSGASRFCSSFGLIQLLCFGAIIVGAALFVYGMAKANESKE